MKNKKIQLKELSPSEFLVVRRCSELDCCCVKWRHDVVVRVPVVTVYVVNK
jgi:hypothetical protein